MEFGDVERLRRLKEKLCLSQWPFTRQKANACRLPGPQVAVSIIVPPDCSDIRALSKRLLST